MLTPIMDPDYADNPTSDADVEEPMPEVINWESLTSETPGTRYLEVGGGSRELVRKRLPVPTYVQEPRG